MSQMIRVLLADHNPILRAALRGELEQTTDVITVKEAGTGKEALLQIEALLPDVAVLECHLPEMSGTGVATAIRNKRLPSRVLAFGTTATLGEILPMLQAGALGYVLRNEEPERIVTAIRAVAQGMGWFSSAVMAQVPIWLDGVWTKGAELTQKEMAVLRLVVQGKSNKEIATALGVSKRAVEYHVSSILRKLKLDSRTKVAVWAKEQGLD